jgi:hypothetical protein
MSTFKLDHYVFPAAPALCLLCARAWEDIQTEPAARRHAAARIGAMTAGPLLIAIGVAMGYLLVMRLTLPAATIVVPAAIIACGLALTAVVWRRSSVRRPAVAPWAGLIAMCVTYAGLILFALPALEAHKVAPDLARFVVSRAAGGDRIASYRMNRLTPAFRFYVNRHTHFLHGPADAEAFFRLDEPFYCVMGREAYDELIARGVDLAILYQREGVWVTSGRAFWRSRLRLSQFVVVGKAR